MSVNKNISINLLEQDIFTTSVIGRILTWALSVGRYIVVFTELIVILSFLSRFKLDRQLTDLTSEIVKQSAIIESYGDIETEVRALQDQLGYIRLKIEQPIIHEYLSDISSRLPSDVVLNSVSITGESISIEAEALSPKGMQVFINNLSNMEDIDDVVIGTISAKDQGNFLEFSLTLKTVNAQRTSSNKSEKSSKS